VSTSPEQSRHPGGAFIYEPVHHDIFVPEEFSEEQKQLYKSAHDFCCHEVLPLAEAIDHKKPGVLKELMTEAAELGLFMAEIPEAYGGLELDKASGMLIAEALSAEGSFAVTHGAHTGIGTLPLVYYGNEEQKSRYLPKLVSGEYLAAYCLSEAGSGSDALAAKTTARLSADGAHYVLNGTKAWITNGGFADLFTIFAQVVDGDELKFTAFLVERGSAGLSIGKEERKLGIRGSSTTLVILDDVQVPKTNVLGQIGRGHKIAFNILNIGRWKLGIGAIGVAKYALSEGCKYANERHQFKKPIATFGLIRQKLAQSATRIFAGESMAYRTGGLIDSGIHALERSADDYWHKSIEVIEEFTIEASVLKVFGSEACSVVVDEMLQVHGGNGFTEDYAVERLYRDCRINRIFEGTNEINRLIIPATLLKRALKGKLPLMQFTGQVIEEIGDPSKLPQKGTGLMADEIHATEMVKRALVYASSYAAQKYLADLKDKQRILGGLADVIIELYAMDASVSRALKATDLLGEKKSQIHRALAKLYCFDARANAFQILRRIAMFMTQGEELDALYNSLEVLDQRYRCDIMTLQEEVADRMLGHEGYDVG
jgi:alkylation response protein AidB-like acyl-CoA dehydrogenase